MKTLRKVLIAVALLCVAGGAHAIAAIEFMKMDSAQGQSDVLKPIIISFLSKGYKKVPDWARLASLVRAKILEKGYTYQSLESVAEEAAVGAGMTR